MDSAYRDLELFITVECFDSNKIGVDIYWVSGWISASESSRVTRVSVLCDLVRSTPSVISISRWKNLTIHHQRCELSLKLSRNGHKLHDWNVKYGTREDLNVRPRDDLTGYPTANSARNSIEVRHNSLNRIKSVRPGEVWRFTEIFQQITSTL